MTASAAAGGGGGGGGGAGAAAVVVAREARARRGWRRARPGTRRGSARRCAGQGIGRGRWGAVGGKRRGCLGGSGRLLRGSRAFTAIFSFTLASCVGGRDACAPSNISCVRFTLRSVSSRIDRFATGASPEASGGAIARGGGRAWRRRPRAERSAAARARSGARGRGGEESEDARRASLVGGKPRRQARSSRVRRVSYEVQSGSAANRRRRRASSGPFRRPGLEAISKIRVHRRTSLARPRRALRPARSVRVSAPHSRARPGARDGGGPRRRARVAELAVRPRFPRATIATSLFGHPPGFDSSRTCADSLTRRTDASPRAATAPPDPPPPLPLVSGRAPDNDIARLKRAYVNEKCAGYALRDGPRRARDGAGGAPGEHVSSQRAAAAAGNQGGRRRRGCGRPDGAHPPRRAQPRQVHAPRVPPDELFKIGTRCTRCGTPRRSRG